MNRFLKLLSIGIRILILLCLTIPVCAQTPQTCPQAQQNQNIPAEQKFIDMMIHHQQMSIKMAQKELQTTQSKEIKEIAEEIIEDSQEAITDLQQIRRQRYGKYY